MCLLKVNIKIHYSKCLWLVKPQTQKNWKQNRNPSCFSQISFADFSLLFWPNFLRWRFGGAVLARVLYYICTPILKLGSWTRWWFQIFFFFMFIPTWGTDPIWRSYFSDGLKPQTSDNTTLNKSVALTGGETGWPEWGWKTWKFPPPQKKKWWKLLVKQQVNPPLEYWDLSGKRVEVIIWFEVE